MAQINISTNHSPPFKYKSETSILMFDPTEASIPTLNQSQVTSEASSFAPDTDPEAVDESSKVRVSFLLVNTEPDTALWLAIS